MPVLVPDQLVEKWRVKKLLAQGGQGAVYEAVREDIGQRGALKVLLANRTTPALLERFIREARAVNAIKHPSIPQVMDHGVFDDGTAWMVMEFIDGETLEARLTKRRVTREEALIITEQVASALDAAHRKNIIHRDVKPSNIMLVSEEDSPIGERAMVLDFGIAKLIEAEGVTSTGNLVGTPIYMAYEQGVRAKDVDGRADVYSLGVVLYQMLTRRVPFRYRKGEGPWAVLTAKTQPPTPIETYAADLPGELVALVNAMVQKDKVLRPTIAEVRAKLRQLQGLPPRQTGSQDALGPASGARATSTLPPGSGPIDYDEDDDLDPTGSAVSSVVDVEEIGPTPSEQKARGEISPQPPIPVPQSLSEVQTRPAPLPPLKASPEAKTAQPAPTQLVPEAQATPSAPTMSAGQPAGSAAGKDASPSRVGVGALAIGALALSAIGTVILVTLPERQPKPDPTIPAADARRDFGASSSRADIVPPPDLGVPPDMARPPEGQRSSSRAKCPSRLADSSCILTPMLARQREALAAALQENGGVHLCPGERLIIGGLPERATVSAPASWLKRQKLDLLLYALKGLPTDLGVYPVKVEVQCQK